jgi:predicted nucleic acid-binding protein
MNEAFDDAMVTGWEPLAAGITLPDPDDAHVVAAALVGRADVIVTENIRHFPDDVQIITEQAAAMKRPTVESAQLLDRLSRSGAPQFAHRVRMESMRPSA